MAAKRESAGRQDPEGRVVRDEHGFMSFKAHRAEKAPAPVASKAPAKTAKK